MRIAVNGSTVFATTGGGSLQRGQPVAVLLHGAGMDHSVWSLQTRYLAHHGYDVVALDLPGHGRSDGEPLTSIEAMASWLEQFLDAAKIDRAALVGHSMGVLIAIEFAASFPARCDKAVLAGAAARMPVHPELLAAAKNDDPLAFELMTSWCHHKQSHFGGHAAPGGWMLGSARRLLEQAKEGVLWCDLHACNEYQGAAAALAKISAAVTVINGQYDRMAPARGAKKMAAAIPGAVYVEIADAGHMAMSERPQQFTQALAAGLR